MTDVVHSYQPRGPFQAFHRRHQRWAMIVAHRRAGKTVAVLNDIVVRALRTRKPDAFYAYIAPYYGQAKQASWMYLKKAVARLQGVKVSESELTLTLPNGSRVRVFGADNPDALRGLYFDGVILDEFGDMAGRVWSEVLRPALADRRGWAVFIGTPKGKNKFYEMKNAAIADPEGWFYLELRASTSGLLDPAEHEDLKRTLSPEEQEQELECNFEASIKGAYYSTQLADLERRGQLITTTATDPLYDLAYPVHVAHDPGRDDAWAIWFWQYVDGQVRFIDYWEESGYDAGEVLDMLELRYPSYETMWLPHDALHKTAQSKKSILDQFRAANAPARQVKNPDEGNRVMHGINAVRSVLRTYPIVIDATRCRRGIDALKNYSRKWNEEASVFSDKPKHDQWSHGADAFRYACLALSMEAVQRSAEQGRKRRAVAANEPTFKPLQPNVITFGDAFKKHQQMAQARRNTGLKERI